MKKIGRNELCACGSGKKYKKCCIEKDKEKFLLNKEEKISHHYHCEYSYKYLGDTTFLFCPICKKEFDLEHEHYKYQCPDCKKEFDPEGNLEIYASCYMCNVCGQEFHVESGFYPQKCGICEYDYQGIEID